MSNYSTVSISNWIECCDSIEELQQEILPLLRDQRLIWKEKIGRILEETGYSCREFARACHVSEPAVRKWKKGSLPQSRDMYIRIGFAAGYDLQEMNTFLRRYGRCPQLYVKSLEDSVCMYVLTSADLPHTYDAYLELLDTVRQQLADASGCLQGAQSTQFLSQRLADISSREEMLAFAVENVPSYRQRYARLYSFIIAFLQENLMIEQDQSGDRRISFHEMANESQWSSSLRHCISEIRNKRWFPLRNKIISLGLHLNMETSAINYMLQCAQMEPLYAKNPVEAAVMWAINEAVLNSSDACIARDGSADLCQFVKSVLIRLNLSESEFLIDDL